MDVTDSGLHAPPRQEIDWRLLAQLVVAALCLGGMSGGQASLLWLMAGGLIAYAAVVAMPMRWLVTGSIRAITSVGPRATGFVAALYLASMLADSPGIAAGVGSALFLALIVVGATLVTWSAVRVLRKVHGPAREQSAAALRSLWYTAKLTATYFISSC